MGSVGYLLGLLLLISGVLGEADMAPASSPISLLGSPLGSSESSTVNAGGLKPDVPPLGRPGGPGKAGPGGKPDPGPLARPQPNPVSSTNSGSTTTSGGTLSDPSASASAPVAATDATTEASSGSHVAASPSSDLPEVFIKGRVLCLYCATHHREEYSKRKREGILGATVKLTCPERSANTTSYSHGRFKLVFQRRQAPFSFPQSCTIFVVNSTLPRNCSVPLVNEPVVPSVNESSSKSLTFNFPTFEFTPSSCN